MLGADDAEKAKQVAFEIFGETRLIRVGQAPKCLLLYRTTDKIASAKHGKIDILSKSKQFVAYGVHQDTQERYKWLDLEPTNVPLDDIPSITAKQVEDFINATAHINGVHQSSDGKNSNNLGVVIGKMTDGREKELSDMVFCKVLSHKQEIDTWDDDDVSAIADEIWGIFCIRCDLTNHKSNGKPYTVEDVRNKIIYLLQDGRKNKYFKDRNIEGNRHEQFYKPFLYSTLIDIRKDFMSGDLFCKHNSDKWINIESITKALKAKADDVPFVNDSKIENHIDLLKRELEPQLLIDFEKWDGVDRIAQIASAIMLDHSMNMTQEHLCDLLKEWLKNIYDRVTSDSEVQNTVLIFKGRQGVGKDYLINNIFEALDMYYTGDTTTPGDERSCTEVLNGNIVCHFSEIDKVYTQKNMAFFKSCITAGKKNLRKYYAKTSETIILRSSIVGTTNTDIEDFLLDTTGNRRIWFFDIDRIDWNYPRGQSSQILAQAKHLCESGFKTSNEAQNAMSEYIKSHTPASLHSQIGEMFDAKVKFLENEFCKYRFENSEITDILTEIATHFRIPPNKVLNYLSKTGRRKKTNQGMQYFRLGNEYKEYELSCSPEENIQM